MLILIGVFIGKSRRQGCDVLVLIKIETELLRQLQRDIRDLTVDYLKLRKQHLGMSGGAWNFMLLNRFGPKETATRSISRSSTEGLKFLHSIGRLDLAVETVVLREEY